MSWNGEIYFPSEFSTQREVCPYIMHSIVSNSSSSNIISSSSSSSSSRSSSISSE